MVPCRNLKSAGRAYGETSSPQARRAPRGHLHPLRPRCGRGRLGGAARQRSGGGLDEHATGGTADHEPRRGAPGRPGDRRDRRPRRGGGRRSRRRSAAPGDAPSRRPIAAAAATIDAGMRFTMAGVRCAPPARSGEVLVRLRTSEDGQSWSRWYAVTLERVAEEGGEEQAFTEPIWTGGGRYLQVAAEASRRRRAGRRPPARRARRDHQQHRGRRPHGGGRRRPAQGGRGRRRASPHVRRRGDDDQARDRDPRRLGRQRVLALRVARLRRGQDGVRAPHGQRATATPPRRRPRSSAASTPTTPGRSTGATSATTS